MAIVLKLEFGICIAIFSRSTFQTEVLSVLLKVISNTSYRVVPYPTEIIWMTGKGKLVEKTAEFGCVFVTLVKTLSLAGMCQGILGNLSVAVETASSKLGFSVSFS